MHYINTLQDGDDISDIYYCKMKKSAQSKYGKTYYSLVLQDKTGTIDAKVWTLNNSIEHFEAEDYIFIEGRGQSFNDTLQISVTKARKAREGEYDVKDYMPCTDLSVDSMYEELLGLIDSVVEKHLNRLLLSFFAEDPAFAEKFKTHSAAKTIHHGFIGGLLQHTLAVAKMCDFMAQTYSIINRDLLITAAICHDIGKLDEISEFPKNDYTDDGNLMGHIVIGAMMVRDKMKEQEDFPDQLGKELLHCILSHHGELEYGSPKKPALIEAAALNLADNADARLETFAEALDKSQGKTEWLGYNRMLDANIRKTLI